MLPLVFSSIGTRGALVLGFTIAELMTYYWNSKQSPPKIYILGRRIHHGEIGALLALSLLFGKFPLPAAILAGVGGGLIKDDFSDIAEWFRFTKGRNLLKERLLAYRRYLLRRCE
jgi:hypothetical protein